METKRKKIAFLISHKPDIRYIKRFNVLINHFDIIVVYWNKTKSNNVFSYPGIEIKEITIPANQTNPIKRIPQTLKFSKMSFKQLTNTNADIVYAGNLDMLMVATKYANHSKGIKVVYEIADLHRLIIDEQRNLFKKLLSRFLKKKEEKLCKKVDLLVLTSMRFFDVYYKNLIDEDKVVFMPNIPDNTIFKDFKKNKHDDFVVAFVGSVRYKQQLSMLIEAATSNNINVLIAGKDADGDSFKNKYFGNKQVVFLGEFDYRKDICNIYSGVDCIYSVYDADMTNVRIALPNKLYESIATCIPIIVAKNTYLASLVEQYGCGCSVSHKNVDELIQTLTRLSTDKTFYLDLVRNCANNKDVIDPEKYNAVFLSKMSNI